MAWKRFWSLRRSWSRDLLRAPSKNFENIIDMMVTKLYRVLTRAASLTFSIAMLSFIACFLLNCNRSETGKASVASVLPEYAVLVVAPRPTTLFLDFPATIQGQQNIEIRPKVDGYVESIYVDEGATVKKGQPLFKISAPQYEQEVRTAKADILIAEADVNAAQMQVDKVQPLVDKRIISKYELESAQFSLQARQAALAQAHARLANAMTNLGYTAIASPVDGVIGTIPYKIGSLVSPGTVQPLTTVSNIGNVYAYFPVNEKEMLHFAKNMGSAGFQEGIAKLPSVSLVMANGLELSEKGRIDAASGLINTETGSFNMRAIFRNPGKVLRSGSSGNVRLPQQVDSALIIPQKVTYELQGKTIAFELDSANVVRSVEIQVLAGGNGQYYVVESGLHPGDRVLIEGVATLKEGETVKPRMVDADSLYARICLPSTNHL
jgi:membrane fusion protein (multidrug efflux system)